MDIIRVTNGDYDRYEELLLQRDQLEKDAFEYQQRYTREFGDLTVESFQLKVDCIALKKSIAFCIAAKNRGVEPDAAKLNQYLASQMAAYRNQLEEMISERDAAQKGKPISFYELGEIKKIYRRIAKLLHPDISTLTEDYPELKELFGRVMIAYHCNDLQELRELEVLINKVLSDNGVESMNVVIPDIAQRIIDLENEIEQILTNEPYIYKELFKDAFRVQSKKEAYEKEIAEYEIYKAQLEVQLNTLMGSEQNG